MARTPGTLFRGKAREMIMGNTSPDDRHRHARGSSTRSSLTVPGGERGLLGGDPGAVAGAVRTSILVTGATGYVGGRLLASLEGRGLRVRCLVRDPERLEPTEGSPEVLRGDLLDRRSLERALVGVDVAYYLVHSMEAGVDFVERDRRAAENFAAEAARAGVRRIVYLGGLGSGPGLSPHLQSRQEVGRILRSTGVPVLELRASIVLGSGSFSFEMIRALVERLPVMITPRWVEVEAQPIAIDDLLAYLLEAAELPLEGSRIFEIGGADRVTYGDLMREYARQRRLRRLMIRVPVLTPRLSSLWLALVTPSHARVGRALVESIRHPTVVEDSSAGGAFRVRPAGIERAIEEALRTDGPDPGARRAIGTRLIDSRSTWVEVSPRSAFDPIRKIGGGTGWYACDRLWKLRGVLDLLVGGVGLRRGRVDPEELDVGDVLDCWRVVRFEEGRRLLLAAEMRLPGRAWLDFEVSPEGDGSRIRQTAIFEPRGVPGLLYWYGILPLHAYVFRGMLRGLASAAGAA